jgi:hypothetical protein
MKRILKEPLLHFLLLGAAIFAAYGLVSKRSSGEPGKIVISVGQVAAMAESFAGTWRRPPTREELEGLIRDRVQEEVYYREAMALGLDKEDTIIRRRLRQKLEFLTDDVAALAEPTDDELSAYLKAHADTFRVQRQFTSAGLSRPRAARRNLRHGLLAQLQQVRPMFAVGRSIPARTRFRQRHHRGAKQFGENSRRSGQLSLGQWQGPVESAYGVHLVFISERTEGRVPALAEVRDAASRANVRRLEG